MPAVALHRIDPARKMRRYYLLDVQPDLFGAWVVVREWGRIGQAGRYRLDRYSTAAQAQEQMHLRRVAKQGRGYAGIS